MLSVCEVCIYKSTSLINFQEKKNILWKKNQQNPDSFYNIILD